jgi:hypothetical protein
LKPALLPSGPLPKPKRPSLRPFLNLRLRLPPESSSALPPNRPPPSPRRLSLLSRNP